MYLGVLLPMALDYEFFFNHMVSSNFVATKIIILVRSNI
jgi:hypothetical protein